MAAFERVWRWLEQHPEVVVGVTAGSAVLLLVGLIALPIVLVRLPADYFVREREPASANPARWALGLLRNVLGAVVLLAGVAMLVLPGQGLLTVLAGLLLVDFPGKKALELRIVRREGVRRWVDWIRHKGGVGPLEIPGA